MTGKHGLTRGASYVLLAVVGVLAALYSFVTPLWEAPDEVGHFQNVAELATGRGLPVQRIGQLGEAHQPPLYYMIVALAIMPADLADPTGAFQPNPRFMWAEQGGHDANISVHTAAEAFPFRGHALAIHLARGVSVMMGLLTVALTLAIGWEIFPERRLIGLFGAALVGLTPQFLFISGAVNNDNLLTLAATGAWWQILRALKRPEQWRPWGWVGIWVALALLAKSSGPVVVLVAVVAVLACAVNRRSPALFLRGASAIALVVLLLAGWWFARNQVLYGDPLGWTMYQKVFTVDFRAHPLPWTELPEVFSVQLRSFWGLLGWMNVNPPLGFYLPPAALGILGLLGSGTLLWRFSKEIDDSQKAALTFLVTAAVIQELFLLWIITWCNPSCYQGRYLMPVISPVMLVISFGLINLIPRALTVPALGCVALVLLAIAIFTPFGVIQPAYHPASWP